MTKNLTCIACPRGCRLTVCFDEHAQKTLAADNIGVTGNRCPKGLAYGRQEVICPMRTLTTTIACRFKHGKNGVGKTPYRLPVKTARDIPLAEMVHAISLIRNLSVEKPVRCGDTVGHIRTADGTDIPITACTAAGEQYEL